MIQRIQTLYLLAIVALGITLFFLPVIQFSTPDDASVQRLFELRPTGLTEIAAEYTTTAEELTPVTLQGTWGLLVTTLLIPVLALVIIFLYKKRLVQARLSIFLALLCVGYYAILFVYVWFGKHNVAPDWDILFGACIPLICLVLTLMSVRRILRDEALVRSMDRLR